MMIRSALAAALALTLSCGTAMAEYKDFTVNGELVTKAAQEKFAAETLGASRNPHAMQAGEIESTVKTMLTEMKVTAADARAKGLDKNPEVLAEIAYATDVILMNRAIGDYLKAHPVTDAEIQKAYDEEKTRWGKTEIRLRHIVVKTAEEARAIIAEVKNGASFPKIAAEKSLDQATKDAGGILDWNSPAAYSKAIASAVVGLKKGEVLSEPVNAGSGFHVIKLEDTRPAQMFPELDDERKSYFRNAIMEKKVGEYVTGLVNKAVVK